MFLSMQKAGGMLVEKSQDSKPRDGGLCPAFSFFHIHFAICLSLSSVDVLIKGPTNL